MGPHVCHGAPQLEPGDRDVAQVRRVDQHPAGEGPPAVRVRVQLPGQQRELVLGRHCQLEEGHELVETEPDLRAA